jgi:hypothetical protein
LAKAEARQVVYGADRFGLASEAALHGSASLNSCNSLNSSNSFFLPFSYKDLAPTEPFFNEGHV